MLFGVNDDGTVKGVQVGARTLEDLANEIGTHTYPSLPAYIEQVRFDSMDVVVAEIPKDVPPVVGVYLCSSKPIPPDKPVDADSLQAYRRVGRTNQKEDFMRLRRPMPSDPRLRVQVTGAYLAGTNPMLGGVRGRIWAEEGSATAHALSFHVQPFGCRSSTLCDDLPYPLLRPSRDSMIPSSTYEGFIAGVNFGFEPVDFSSVPPVAEVVATFKDEWGITWKVSRRISLALEGGELKWSDSGEFARRIIGFPPKVTTRA